MAEAAALLIRHYPCLLRAQLVFIILGAIVWLARAYAFFLTLAIVLIIIILDSTYYACCFGMGGTILCSPSLRPFSIGAAAGLEIVQVVRCVEVYRKLVQFHPRGGGNGEAIVGGV